MKFKPFLLLLLFLPLTVLAQRSYTVSGTVTDQRNGETLIGATVLDTRSGKGAVTNLYGHYSLTLKSDSVSLRITYVGYEPQMFDLGLNRNTELNVQMRRSVTLNEVTVTAERTGDVRSSQMSAMDMPVEKIKAVPVLFGEADIIKALQLMPGVQSGSEGNSGLYVRGGGPDENLFLLDGVSLYNVSHLGGFFSAFNTDAIKNVTLYKGSFPARFGGRLSSVLDVTQNNGNDQHLQGNVSVGLISAKLNLEGPINKGRTTFSVSARRTYAELFLIPIILKIDELTAAQMKSATAKNAKFEAGYWFYDLNAKLTHKFSDKSRLYGSFYMGEDQVYGTINTVNTMGEDIRLGFKNRWGNMVGQLRWNYELTPKLFLNLSAAYTQYDNDLVGNIEKLMLSGDTNTSKITGDYKSGIQDITVRADLDYVPDPDHNAKFGTYFVRHIFTPEVASGSISYYDPVQMNGGIDTTIDISNGVVLANEIVAFAEDDWSITESIKLNYGLHFSAFKTGDSLYPSLQPRISGRVMITPDLSVKVGYAWMRQYVHLLSTTSITLPTDLWVPVTENVKPMESHQVAGGIFYSLAGIADFSVEAYYKAMENLIEYKDGATYFGSSENWERLVYAGRGWSYGLELLAQRDIGRLTGWVGYTWSRTMRLFDRENQVINDGKSFPAKYDRRHDISIVLNYKFSDRCDVSATWVYSTGNTATLAKQTYTIASEDPEDYGGAHGGQSALGTLTHYEGRNNYRLPDYHRLDLAANFHREFKPTRHGFRPRRTINVSIYNVYNRQNPYMVYQSSQVGYKNYPSSFRQLSIFPILPSVAYTLYF
ncbi:MAG: carboxypeptidase-like regulatory domain-containing protein [Bacteroidales bacterium]|nr:carboxypeptidase-like regulatory domain-containing protein [Bacteroidales bacterium]